MSRHTPPPWRADGTLVYSYAESSPVATVRKPEDAQLVAAAPQMLEALRFAEPFLALMDHDSDQDIVSPVRLAIVNATRSP